MAVTIQIRRGTKAELNSYGALQNGELAFTTDEQKVYVGDGSNNYLVGAVVSGTGAPGGNGIAGSIYVDTAASGIYYSDGSGYIRLDTGSLGELSGTLDDIADGTSYQRVAATEVDDSGYIIRLNDGTYIVTASGAYAHINNDELHRVINDSGTSSIELWSSQKINEELSALVNGIDWQDSVISKSYCDVPSGVISDGDRYLICDTASGTWSGYSDYITEYITASGGWVYIEPNEGFATWVEDEDKIYVYNGTSWGAISNISTHNNLSGLQGGQAGEYYHLTNADYLALTTNLTETITDIVGSTISGGTGISVNWDDASDTVTISIGTHGHTGPADGGQIDHSSLTGVGANDHHNRQHAIDSASDHTVTAVSGYVLGTVADNTLGMMQIDGSMMGNVDHNDLQNIGEDDHHNRQHAWLSTDDHTFGPWAVGSFFQVAVGGTSVETTETVDGGTLT